MKYLLIIFLSGCAAYNGPAHGRAIMAGATVMSQPAYGCVNHMGCAPGLVCAVPWGAVYGTCVMIK